MLFVSQTCQKSSVSGKRRLKRGREREDEEEGEAKEIFSLFIRRTTHCQCKSIVGMRVSIQCVNAFASIFEEEKKKQNTKMTMRKMMMMKIRVARLQDRRRRNRKTNETTVTSQANDYIRTLNKKKWHREDRWRWKWEMQIREEKKRPWSNESIKQLDNYWWKSHHIDRGPTSFLVFHIIKIQKNWLATKNTMMKISFWLVVSSMRNSVRHMFDDE